MRTTTLAGVVAVALLVPIGGATPTTAMPVANLGLSQADTSESAIPVQWRRHRYGPRRYGGPRYYGGPGYWGPPPYGYYPYYRPYYAPGPYFRFGPFGFGF